MADENENNLVQRREDKRTLEKMRRKLATSGHMGKNNISKLKPTKSTLRIWPFAAVAVALLLGLNFVLHTQQDKVVSAMGGKTVEKAPLAPPAGASLDEQARFWAYASYDIIKLKSHFAIPKGSVINSIAARQNLERLLPENLGPEVRNEIFTYQQNAPPPMSPKLTTARKK
jgi:hypothetical protein